MVCRRNKTYRNLLEELAGVSPAPAKGSYQPGPSVAWLESDLGCEAYTGGLQAVRLSLEMKLNAEPTSFSERKAASRALSWRGAIGPPGSKSRACQQEFYRNLGSLMVSPMRSKRRGAAFKK
jgi:hypothetical protein